MKERKFQFGVTVRDKVTGYTGVVTGFMEYMTGSIMWGLTPKCGEGSTNAQPKGEWIDESYLEEAEGAEPLEL